MRREIPSRLGDTFCLLRGVVNRRLIPESRAPFIFLLVWKRSRIPIRLALFRLFFFADKGLLPRNTKDWVIYVKLGETQLKSEHELIY